MAHNRMLEYSRYSKLLKRIDKIPAFHSVYILGIGRQKYTIQISKRYSTLVKNLSGEKSSRAG